MTPSYIRKVMGEKRWGSQARPNILVSKNQQTIEVSRMVEREAVSLSSTLSINTG